jgi:hypothetical protein
MAVAAIAKRQTTMSVAVIEKPDHRRGQTLAMSVAIKSRVRSAQLHACLAVNRELILLYWSIGRDIVSRQKAQGWGAKIIDRLAGDLGTAFPAPRAAACAT